MYLALDTKDFKSRKSNLKRIRNQICAERKCLRESFLQVIQRIENGFNSALHHAGSSLADKAKQIQNIRSHVIHQIEASSNQVDKSENYNLAKSQAKEMLMRVEAQCNQ